MHPPIPTKTKMTASTTNVITKCSLLLIILIFPSGKKIDDGHHNRDGQGVRPCAGDRQAQGYSSDGLHLSGQGFFLSVKHFPGIRLLVQVRDVHGALLDLDVDNRVVLLTFAEVREVGPD